MRRIRSLFAAVTILLLFSFSPPPASAQANGDVQLIPKPVSVVPTDGTFLISPLTPLRHDHTCDAAVALLRDAVKSVTGFDLTSDRGGNTPAITLGLNPSLAALGPEGYRLTVRKEGVNLEAANSRGLIYGVQTFRQLLPVNPTAGLPGQSIEWRLPCIAIEDQPRFSWRGLMLDCSRTFQSPDYIRKTIDRMAFYKMNVLHLHLTDDQGWRLEIKKYPELTVKGARFPAKYNEPPEHQGFYSQAEMRALVSYGAARNITLVPEIEMPGHSLAALSCFPELSCSGGPFEIFPFFSGPNITRDILCAGNEKTFEFLDNVLAEVAALFPSQFLHIGGDEAPKDAWKKCPKCQARIRSEGLKGEDELQSWFIRRVEKILQKHGKRLIGWDEILEGGLAPNAAVMSWRGTSGGIAAANSGHDVVMSPTSHCYFDYSYEKIDSRRAYSYEPVPADVAVEKVRHILGLQANFWSHIDREPDKVDRQIFPRLLALAERGWSPKETVDWADFSRRLQYHLAHLDHFGVRYYLEPLLPAPAGAKVGRK